MKPYKLAPDIYVIEDFVTEDQQQRALSFINSVDEEAWYHNQTKKGQFFYGRQYSGESPDFILEITENLKNVISGKHLYGSDRFRLEIMRHRKGDFHEFHKDNHEYSTDIIRFGICIYYNDDYLGGALNYPDLNIIHKPKARSLVLHGGNILHGTTEIQSEGYRYFSTAFAKGTPDEPVLLNPELFRDIEESDGSFYY